MAKGIIEPYLEHLFNACLRLRYFPKAFRKAITIALPKTDKRTYATPSSWRPIALLSHLGKMLEKVVANRLKELALEHSLLPATQMAFVGRSTTTALQYILNPIYAGWSPMKNLVTSMLCLDMTGAYDHVSHERLLEVLSSKGIPDWMINFLWSFLSERTAKLVTPGHTSNEFPVPIGIPQGSALSPILFLFFAAPLLEIFDQDSGVRAMGFSDDSHLLATSQSYEENCAMLERAHEKVLNWAAANGIHFLPSKYKVIHFTRPYQRGVPVCLPDIAGLDKNNEDNPQPAPHVRVLGVILDRKLSWDAHIHEVS